MLYRTLSGAPGEVGAAGRRKPAPVAGVRGARAEESCPVCDDPGPHQIMLTVAS